MLPNRKIFVLNFERRQIGGIVQFAELIYKDTEGHAVSDDVMHINRKQVAICAYFHHSCTQERSFA